MEIVKVTPYNDRGLLRRRLDWVDGETAGVADTHCAITGVVLGPNYTLCVRHCRYYGHFSREVSDTIGRYIREEISEQEMLALFLSWSLYPDDQPPSE